MGLPQTVLSPGARRELLAIHDWIEADSSPLRAEAFMQRIEHILDLVAAMPGIGRVRADLDGQPRAISVGPWIVFYDPLPGGAGIYVLHIVDGRRDVPELEL